MDARAWVPIRIYVGGGWMLLVSLPRTLFSDIEAHHLRLFRDTQAQWRRLIGLDRHAQSGARLSNAYYQAQSDSRAHTNTHSQAHAHAQSVALLRTNQQIWPSLPRSQHVSQCTQCRRVQHECVRYCVIRKPDMVGCTSKRANERARARVSESDREREIERERESERE